MTSTLFTVSVGEMILNQCFVAPRARQGFSLLIRDKLNEGFNLLRDLSVKLKTINRDQKASAREMQSVRSTLRSIQGLKI